MTERVLTGITTTGTPHLGNYVGAIRPAVAASRDPDVESFYFLADYHALIKCDEPARIAALDAGDRRQLAGRGLDPERVTFYRQSDIPEIPELTWLLTCVTGKGLLNRAHAYKAAVDKNIAARRGPRRRRHAGLFMYPVLMAADILLFNAHKRAGRPRPGAAHRDGARHRRSASTTCTASHDLFMLPEAVIEEHVAHAARPRRPQDVARATTTRSRCSQPRAQALKEAIARIVTDSRAPGEPKEPEGSRAVPDLPGLRRAGRDRGVPRRPARRHRLGRRQAAAVRARSKREVAPMRERYEHLMAQPERIEEACCRPARRKARAVARRRSWPSCGARSACAPLAAAPARRRTPQPRPRKRRCRTSSSTAKPTGASISSWRRRRRRGAAAKRGLCRRPRGRRVGQAAEGTKARAVLDDAPVDWPASGARAAAAAALAALQEG